MFFNDLYGYFADQRSLALRTIFKIYVAGGKTRRKLERSAVFREHISLCFFFFKFHKEGWVIAIDKVKHGFTGVKNISAMLMKMATFKG